MSSAYFAIADAAKRTPRIPGCTAESVGLRGARGGRRDSVCSIPP